jgi:hypothetical protein
MDPRHSGGINSASFEDEEGRLETIIGLLCLGTRKNRLPDTTVKPFSCRKSQIAGPPSSRRRQRPVGA